MLFVIYLIYRGIFSILEIEPLYMADNDNNNNNDDQYKEERKNQDIDIDSAMVQHLKNLIEMEQARITELDSKPNLTPQDIAEKQDCQENIRDHQEGIRKAIAERVAITRSKSSYQDHQSTGVKRSGNDLPQNINKK